MNRQTYEPNISLTHSILIVLLIIKQNDAEQEEKKKLQLPDHEIDLFNDSIVENKNKIIKQL
jgi:hypothetical protein